MVQLPRVASEVVPSHVVQRVAAEVTERAEVCRLFVMDSHLVLPQFGQSSKRLFTYITAVTTDPCVKRLVLFQAVTPCGAERTVTTTVGSSTFVLERDMLGHASILFAGEGTVLAVQTFRFRNTSFFLLMDKQGVTSQRHLRFGYK